MGLTPVERFAYNMFGERARRSSGIAKLEEALHKAQMPIRPEAYIAKTWLVTLLTFVSCFLIGMVVAIFGYLSYQDGDPLGMWMLLGGIALVVLGPLVAYMALATTPASNAKKRGKNINLRLAYATNYIAAMASAGVIPAEIFKSLAKQDIYGEVAREAAWIYKDLVVHGKDIVTALRRAIDRTPSVKFQELLQGAITTITSGGDLTAYFRQKAQRYQWENRVEQKTFIETMGLMAETYVTAAVAGPLFLIVMVAIIVLMGSGEMSQLQMIIFILLPVINGGFMYGLWKMIPEV